MSGNAHQRRAIETAVSKALAKANSREVDKPPVSNSVSKSSQVLTSTRFVRFFDHGSLQTLFGILGGLVGTLLDGRYLGLLCLWIAYAINRSRALQGLKAASRTVIYFMAILVSAPSLYFLGTKINLSKPHTYTPSDYALAIKNGTPLPIVERVTNVYNSVTEKARQPIISFTYWKAVKETPKGFLWQAEIVNNGDAIAKNTEGTGVGVVMPKSVASENSIFKELEARAFDKDGMKNDLPPGGEYRRSVNLYSPLATAENIRAVSSGEKVAYLPYVVSYEDDKGDAYLAELCMYQGNEMNALRYCPGHNSTKRVKKP